MQQRDERQAIMADWVNRCFRTANDPKERVTRLLEEAIEAAQAEGIPREHVGKLVDFVYAKVPGEPRQEIGGVGVCLLAYAASRGMSADDAERSELRRVLNKSLEHFRERGAVKAAAGVEVTRWEP